MELLKTDGRTPSSRELTLRMVNTFLVDSDFRVSASKLDDSRLGKQRVEAHQILLILKRIRFSARVFSVPDYPVDLDTPKEQRKNWIEQVVTAFKASGFKAILVRDNVALYYTAQDTLPHQIESGHSFEIDHSGQCFEYKGKRKTLVQSGHWSEFVFPEDLYITDSFGFWRHPAVLMWLGFEEALKDYINAHIELWISRGNENTMKKYPVGEYKRPSWSFDPEVHKNFRSTLLEREIERRESGWYMLQDDFISAWVHTQAHGDYFKQTITTVPSASWFNHFLPEQLLQLGKFPGFIWP